MIIKEQKFFSYYQISHFCKNKKILNNSVRIFTSFMNNHIFWWLKQQDGDLKMELNRPTRLRILAIIFELEKTFNIQLSFMKKHSMTSPIRSFLFEWIVQSWLSIKHNFIALKSFLHFSDTTFIVALIIMKKLITENIISKISM